MKKAKGEFGGNWEEEAWATCWWRRETGPGELRTDGFIRGAGRGGEGVEEGKWASFQVVERVLRFSLASSEMGRRKLLLVPMRGPDWNIRSSRVCDAASRV